MTLFRAETERYDIVGFSMVTAKSLASGTGFYDSIVLGESKLAGERLPGPDVVFFRGESIRRSMRDKV